MNRVSIKKYNLDDFEQIKNTFDIPELNKTSIKMINNISKKVGAPTYRKTPVFKKKKMDPKYNNSNFTKTTFTVKIDENEINQDKIRELLNKLTNNNYDVISQEIIDNLQHFIYTQNDMVLMDFGKSIFEVSSVNKFWVKLYAKLYNKLINTFPKMHSICVSEFKKLLNIFDTFEFGHEDNYDEFCRINKDNEKRRSLLSFYTQLYKYDILGNSDIELLVEKLFTLFQKHIQEKQIIEEIFENIVIIITNLSSEIMNEQVGDYIQENLVKIYKCLHEKKTSKKIIFKLLDIFEEMDIDIDEFDED
tara:strand:- start:2391 stop:3305 length:915 start_codon:yes stop_codon:yes gene_type:complete